jgi:hypothetical protein
LRNANFYPLLNDPSLYAKEKTFPVGSIKVQAQGFQADFKGSFMGSGEANPRHGAFPIFFPLGEGRSEKKWKSRFLKDHCQSLSSLKSLNPVWPVFYRSYKQPPESQQNHVNSLSSTSTELRILKLIQGFYKPNKQS